MGDSYIKRAIDYAESVANDKIPACKWVKLSCERQLNDLLKSENKSSRLKFDRERAEKICRFAESLPHVKGDWAKKNTKLKLEPWQIFIYTTVFGWVDKNQNRRFKKVYIEVPRKNGKSTFTAPVGLYMLAADAEHGAEVYSAATTREQAKIVFQIAHQMAKRKTEFQKYYGVSVMTHNINKLLTASKFESLSAEGNSLDGLNTHCAIVDELHAHKTRLVYDVLETSIGSRSQPLIWNITTAGSNRAGICYEQRNYIIKILENTIEDDSYFGIIYTIDEKDDWRDEDTWKKANPNYGVSIYPEDMRDLARKAVESSQSQNAFLTKRLNVWVNADISFMNMVQWDKCEDRTLDINDFENDECFIGLDLATKVDITSKVLVFRRGEEYYIFSSHYLPEERVHGEAHSKSAHYEGWVLDGHMFTTPGNMIDLDYIEAGLREDLARFDVQAICYDPWQAQQMVGHLLDEGAPMVEVRPSVMAFSDPMKMIEALVLAGKIHHDGNPVLTWMVSNVKCHTDAKENIYPRKESPELKIDGFIALLEAMNRALTTDEGSGNSIYENRGILDLEF